MNPKMIGAGLIVVGFAWVYLATESFGRGKTLIGCVQIAAALAFAGRGIWTLIQARNG